jgi:formylglycine-generating enzyme required for sulfatase activity
MQPSRATACTLVLLGGLAGVAVACNAILGNENASVLTTTAGDAAAPIDAGPPDAPRLFDAAADSGADAADGPMVGDAAACPSGKGPAMVNVASMFCIDSTEVTIDQYDRFLTAGKTPGSMGEPMPACGFNKAYAPGGPAYNPATPGAYPVTYVNWCDAFAYCAWAGKRLCGTVGGGAVTEASFATLQNEHYYACSGAGTLMYPYGNTFSTTACNGVGATKAGVALPPGTLTTCTGGFPGLLDMVGNIEEWQDGCATNAGPMDMCLHGTGSFDYGTPACDYVDKDTRSYQFDDVGIRCCATLP